MQVFDYSGLPLRREKLIPGNTPTGISSSVYRMPSNPADFYRTTGDDLLTYGNFAAGDPPTGWTSGSATLASEAQNRTNSGGTTSMKVTASGANGHGYHDIVTVAGYRYRLRFYYKTTAGDIAQYRITDDRTGTEADIVAYTDLAASASAFSSAVDVFFTAVSVETTIYFASKANADVSYFDDASVYRVTGYGAGQGSDATVASVMPTEIYGKLGASAKTALIMAETNSIRFTIDGSSPSNSTDPEPNNGFLLTAGSNYWLRSWYEIQNFSCLDAVSGTAGKVEVVCYF